MHFFNAYSHTRKTRFYSKYLNQFLKSLNMKLPVITLPKLAEESGYSEEALRSKIARGDFADGIHFIKAPDGRIHFILEEYLKWVVSSSTATVSKSLFTGTGSAIDLR
jgi:hypothetical protein